MEKEIEQATARVCTLERQAAQVMEEERRRMNVNWRGRSNSSAFSNAKSKSNKK